MFYTYKLNFLELPSGNSQMEVETMAKEVDKLVKLQVREVLRTHRHWLDPR